MSEEQSIQVNFGRPMGLFPLDTPALLPQQVIPLHIFEPRYRQMVDRALDGAGQFAMAVFLGQRWKQEYHGRPPLRPAVCIAQIIRHERLADGRYNLLVQGVCRARIYEETPPSDDTLYRTARLAPVGIGDQEPQLLGVRERLRELLADGPLTRLTAAEWVVERLQNDEIPTSVLLELVGCALLPGREIRYRLLAEGDAARRATLVERELVDLQTLITRALRQKPDEWPKGCSWN